MQLLLYCFWKLYEASYFFFRIYSSSSFSQADWQVRGCDKSQLALFFINSLWNCFWQPKCRCNSRKRAVKAAQTPPLYTTRPFWLYSMVYLGHWNKRSTNFSVPKSAFRIVYFSSLKLAFAYHCVTNKLNLSLLGVLKLA